MPQNHLESTGPEVDGVLLKQRQVLWSKNVPSFETHIAIWKPGFPFHCQPVSGNLFWISQTVGPHVASRSYLDATIQNRNVPKQSRYRYQTYQNTMYAYTVFTYIYIYIHICTYIYVHFVTGCLLPRRSSGLSAPTRKTLSRWSFYEPWDYAEPTGSPGNQDTTRRVGAKICGLKERQKNVFFFFSISLCVC